VTVNQEGNTSCGTISINPPSVSAPANGGTVPITVTTQFSCSLAVLSPLPPVWITVPTAPSLGTTHNLTLTVAPNAAGSSRQGTIRVGNTLNNSEFADLLVTQPAPVVTGCGIITLKPSSLSVPAAGGPQTVGIATQFSGPSCTPGVSVVTQPPPTWLTGLSIDGDLFFTVAPNTGTLRSATIRVANTQNASQSADLVVNQAAAPVACSITLTPSPTSYSPAGQSGNIVVNATNCTSLVRSGTSPDFTFGGSLTASGGTITVQTARRVSATPSSVTVTVTDSPSGVSQSVTLTQRRAAAECFSNPGAVFTGQLLADAGGTLDITPTVLTDCLWGTQITLGQGGPLLTFSAFVNNGFTARFNFSAATPGTAKSANILILNSLNGSQNVNYPVCQNAGTGTFTGTCGLIPPK
jgi:hypothetical protein